MVRESMFGPRDPRRRFVAFGLAFLLLIALPVADHYLGLRKQVAAWWASLRAAPP